MRSSYSIDVSEFKIATDPEHEGKIWLKWSWNDPYWTPNLDHWEVWPSYSYLDSNSTLQWVDLSSESVEQADPSRRVWEFYWEFPVTVEDVHFRLRPISKSRTDGTGVYFEEEYFTTVNKYFGGSTKPDAPSAPSVTQDSYLGTTAVLGLENVSLEGNNILVTKVEFQCIVFDSDDPMEVGTVSRTLEALIDEFGNAKTTVGIGNAYGFKFRARLCSTKVKHGDGADDPIVVRSDWSEMTEMLYGVCKKPKLKVNKFSSTQVEYTIVTTSYAYSYQLEMAPDTSCFVKMDEWERENPQYKRDSEQRKAAADRFGIVAEWFHEPDTETATVATKNWVEDVLSVARDLAYYRARSLSAQNNGFFSPWSTVDDESTLSFSDGLRAPIVWNATEFAEVDDPSIQLSVMHNSPNGSPSCLCVIYYGINSMPSPQNRIDVLPPQGQQNGNVVYNVNFDLTGFDEETVIYWKAVTYEGGAAIEANCSPWSEIISFAIHQKPGLTVRIKDIRENSEINRLPVVGSYPIKYITETTYFDSHYNEILVTSMSFKVVSRQSYRRLDRYGNPVVIKDGDVLYSIIDVEDPRDKERTISASDITLDNGVWYTLEATVTLNNGASAVNTFDFTIDMGAKDYIIECTGSVNPNNVSLNLIPAAVKYEEYSIPLFPPYWEEISAPFEVSDFAGSPYDFWTNGRTLYFGNTYSYNIDQSELSTISWSNYVDGRYMMANDYWTAEDGSMHGMTASFATVYDTETGQFVRDTMITPYGTSDFQFRFKYYDYETSSFEDHMLSISNSTPQWYKYEDSDWVDISENVGHCDAVYGNGSQIWLLGGQEMVLSTYTNDYVISGTSIYDVTSAFATHMEGSNIWTVGERSFYSNDTTHYEIDITTYPFEWKPIAWNGLTSFYGRYVKVVDGVAYVVVDSFLWRLDINTNTWSIVHVYSDDYEYYGIFGSRVWTDGDNLYYSKTHVYNEITGKWDFTTWEGLPESITEEYFCRYDLWTDGDNLYYSHGSYQYVLDKTTKVWSPKTFYGDAISGRDIWHMNGEIYATKDGYDAETYYYKYDPETSTWTQYEWGSNPTNYTFLGRNVWEHDGRWYNESRQSFSRYELDPETMSITRLTDGPNVPYCDAENIWTDGTRIYMTGFCTSAYAQGHYGSFVLNEDTLEWEYIEIEGFPADDDYKVGIDVWTDLNGNVFWYGGNLVPKKLVNKTTNSRRLYANNVTLSVYRKNDDGTFVTIAENIDNTTGMNVTDPHPNLGGANYRIVATDMESGAQTFYDPPPYDMKCTDIILQWDEYYASKPNDGRNTEIPEMGNMVRLPYNVDVSETANMESEMVSYIGRSNPVSYYGTQTGYTASWSTEIPKYDKETIKMLRKLQVFPGDVYVREPNGTGYWARVTVTFPINHLSLTVSVSISITRVEGGV